MKHRIRLLDAADAEEFRALRLGALERHPCEFGAAYQEEAAQTLAQVRHCLDQETVFGGFVDGTLQGVAGFGALPGAKKCHKGVLWGVYVAAGARGKGLGRALVSGVIEHARAEVDQLHATVVTVNQAARDLYQKLGFHPYGLEPRALKVGDRYYDQELMVLLFEPAPSAHRPVISASSPSTSSSLRPDRFST